MGDIGLGRFSMTVGKGHTVGGVEIEFRARRFGSGIHTIYLVARFLLMAVVRCGVVGHAPSCLKDTREPSSVQGCAFYVRWSLYQFVRHSIIV